MTTLQEAAQAAMKYIRSTADYKAGHPVAIEAAEDLSDALAQQGEQQPVCHGCGIPAGDVHMSTCKSGKWPSRVSNGDTAAPAPQPSQGAVTRRKIFVCAHCDGIYADQTVTQCDCMEGTGADFVEGFAEYPAALQSAQPVAQQDHIPDAGEMVLSDDEILTIAHRKATRYTHAVAPGQVTYGFAVAHLLDFVRAVLEEKTAQPVAQPLSDSEIEKLREKTFSTYNIAQLFGPSLLQHQGVTGVAVSDASHFDKLRCTRSE